MRSPITKPAIAAAVLIACVIALSLWRTTGSGIALADVVAQIDKVKAVRFKWTLRFNGYMGPNQPFSQEERATCLSSGEHGMKSSVEVLDPHGGESTFIEVYVLPQKKTMIRITPKQKKYERQELDDAIFDRIQKLNYMDTGTLVKKIQKCKYESLGRSAVDGVEAEGFRTTDPNYKSGGGFKNPQVDVKMWVDVKTRLPLRYEEVTSADFDRNGNRMSQQYVEYDYQWDVPVDASEFEPVIPDGYTVATAPKKPAPTEENAIKGLKLYADLSGHYPKRSNWIPEYQWSVFEKSEAPAAKRLQEEIKGLTGDEKANRLRDALLPLHGIGTFYGTLVRKAKDPAYYGETVTPKDADKVLMRWEVSDKEYRVIFGDLHAETVSPEKLAELEAALPKVDVPGFEGGFESGVLYPWRTYGKVTARVVTELVGATVPENVIEGKYCLFLDVAPGVANFWDAGLGYSVMVFQKGKKYTLSAFLKSKRGDLQVSFKPGLATDPWTGYGEKMMTITEKWAEYSVTTPVFEADVRPASLEFHIGSAVGGFWIDGVRFYEGDYVPPAAGR